MSSRAPSGAGSSGTSWKSGKPRTKPRSSSHNRNRSGPSPHDLTGANATPLNPRSDRPAPPSSRGHAPSSSGYRGNMTPDTGDGPWPPLPGVPRKMWGEILTISPAYAIRSYTAKREPVMIDFDPYSPDNTEQQAKLDAPLLTPGARVHFDCYLIDFGHKRKFIAYNVILTGPSRQRVAKKPIMNAAPGAPVTKTLPLASVVKNSGASQPMTSAVTSTKTAAVPKPTKNHCQSKYNVEGRRKMKDDPKLKQVITFIIELSDFDVIFADLDQKDYIDVCPKNGKVTKRLASTLISLFEDPLSSINLDVTTYGPGRHWKVEAVHVENEDEIKSLSNILIAEGALKVVVDQAEEQIKEHMKTYTMEGIMEEFVFLTIKESERKAKAAAKAAAKKQAELEKKQRKAEAREAQKKFDEEERMKMAENCSLDKRQETPRSHQEVTKEQPGKGEGSLQEVTKDQPGKGERSLKGLYDDMVAERKKKAELEKNREMAKGIIHEVSDQVSGAGEVTEPDNVMKGQACPQPSIDINKNFVQGMVWQSFEGKVDPYAQSEGLKPSDLLELEAQRKIENEKARQQIQRAKVTRNRARPERAETTHDQRTEKLEVNSGFDQGQEVRKNRLVDLISNANKEMARVNAEASPFQELGNDLLESGDRKSANIEAIADPKVKIMTEAEGQIIPESISINKYANPDSGDESSIESFEESSENLRAEKFDSKETATEELAILDQVVPELMSNEDELLSPTVELLVKKFEHLVPGEPGASNLSPDSPEFVPGSLKVDAASAQNGIVTEERDENPEIGIDISPVKKNPVPDEKEIGMKYVRDFISHINLPGHLAEAYLADFIKGQAEKEGEEKEAKRN